MSHHFICGKGTGPVFLSQCVIAETLTKYLDQSSNKTTIPN